MTDQRKEDLRAKELRAKEENLRRGIDVNPATGVDRIPLHEKPPAEIERRIKELEAHRDEFLKKAKAAAGSRDPSGMMVHRPGDAAYFAHAAQVTQTQIGLHRQALESARQQAIPPEVRARQRQQDYLEHLRAEQRRLERSAELAIPGSVDKLYRLNIMIRNCQLELERMGEDDGPSAA